MCRWLLTLIFMIGVHEISAQTSDNSRETSKTKMDLDVPVDCSFFKLYTRGNPNGTIITADDVNTLVKSGFIPKGPTRILIHGFGGDGNGGECKIPKNAFLQAGDLNVITMDWLKCQEVDGNIDRDEAFTINVRRLKSVSLQLVKLIEFLKVNGLDLMTTSIIGHSLGSHLAGLAGYNLPNKVYSVIGLDPAGDGFRNKKPGERMSKEDAHHVEIIHTNMGNKGVGLNESIGHYDFYINGGEAQPGCGDDLGCNHSRSYKYFAESIISPVGFYGKLCIDDKNIDKESCSGGYALMGGIYRSPITPGVYYVETNDETPFAKGRLR